MALTTAQLATLKSEINNDPRGYGYAALVTGGNTTGLAKMLNEPRTGVVGTFDAAGATVNMVPTSPTQASGVAGGLISIRRNDITGAEILQVIDLSEQVANGTAIDGAVLNACGTMRTISFVDGAGADFPIFKSLKRIFNNTAPNNTTRLALAVLSKKTGGRWEELTVAGSTVNDQDVSAALIS